VVFQAAILNSARTEAVLAHSVEPAGAAAELGTRDISRHCGRVPLRADDKIYAARAISMAVEGMPDTFYVVRGAGCLWWHKDTAGFAGCN